MTATKKAGGKLGLGVKKLESKIDDSIYTQAPAAEPAKPVPGEAATAAANNAGSTATASSSRFSYDTLTAVSRLCGG